MYYCAYGSTINVPPRQAYLDTHGVDPAQISDLRHAVLHHYLLRTNYSSSVHGAGACNIERQRGNCVEGVLMTVTPSVQDVLRIKEGYPDRYTELDVIVRCTATAESVSAITYIVTPETRLDMDLPVSREYRDRILTGASHFEFSASYQQELQRRLQSDPSVMRNRSSKCK